MILWSWETKRRYYELSVSVQLMVGFGCDLAGALTVEFGPFEFWTHRA